MRKSNFSSFSLVLIGLIAVSQALLQCKDKNGKDVDWYLIFKMPNGLDYYYCDSNSCSELTYVKSPLNDKSSPLTLTLAEIEKKTDDSGTIFWNDEKPTKSDLFFDSASYAHSKGIIGFDDTYGFIITHSVPLYPEVVDDTHISLDFPESEQRYAQSMMCISTSASDIEAVAGAFLVDHPQVYAGHIPEAFKQNRPNLANMLDKKRDSSQLYVSMTFHSTAGKVFHKLSKNKDWEIGFYESILKEQIGVGFYVESWGHVKEGLLEANCTSSDDKQNVYSVLEMNFGNNNDFQYTSDHSKWAVSVDKNKPWLCIADMNRVLPQYTRGGGAFCLNEKDVYNAVYKVITETQSCPKPPMKFLE